MKCTHPMTTKASPIHLLYPIGNPRTSRKRKLSIGLRNLTITKSKQIKVRPLVNHSRQNETRKSYQKVVKMSKVMTNQYNKVFKNIKGFDQNLK